LVVSRRTGRDALCGDRSGAIFDRRFLSEESFEDVRGEIHAMLADLEAKNPEFKYKLKI